MVKLLKEKEQLEATLENVCPFCRIIRKKRDGFYQLYGYDNNKKEEVYLGPSIGTTMMRYAERLDMRERILKRIAEIDEILGM